MAIGDLVRVYAQQQDGRSELLWGVLVGERVAQLRNISFLCDLSYGDCVVVRPLCSCGEEHPQYEARERVFRASRRVQFFTKGAGHQRARDVARYLATWAPRGIAASTPYGEPGWVTSELDGDGFPRGLAVQCLRRPGGETTHWFCAFPWATSKRRARAFLDRVPFVVFHQLQAKRAT